VILIANAIYQHNCDLEELAQNTETLVKIVLAGREAGNVLEKLGYNRRQPFKFNLFYWLQISLLARSLQSLFKSGLPSLFTLAPPTTSSSY